jgi:hypothetical protein
MTTTPTTRCIAFALLALSADVALSAPAGRVLVVAGTATLERAGQQSALQAGTLVESGDMLAVGEQSALQVRFTDESIVSLRANSQFRIEDYRFEKSAASDRSLMGLLKGGMRTITGLIGKANQKNYAIRTATSTIGIRGTHFSLVSCNNDCTRPDGTAELNGTFGSVTDGRITVSNDAGAREFAQQDNFYVATSSALPVQLLVPPAILNDRGPAARGRSTNSGAPQDGSVTGAANRSPEVNISTSPQLTVQQSPLTSLTSPLTTVSVNDRPSIANKVTAESGKITVIEVRGFVANASDFSEINARAYTLAELTGEVKELRGASFTNAQTLAAAFGASGAVGTVGSNAAAGAYWIYEAPSPGSTNSLGSHHIWGDTPGVALPTTGVAQYNYAGGTAPQDNFGRTGTFTGSNLMMNFATQRIQSLSAMNMAFGTNSLQRTPTTYAIPAGITWSMNAGPNTLQGVTCTGCLVAPTGVINGQFIGSTLQGYAAGITVFSQALDTMKANAAGNVSAFARQ